jgi:cell division protein FtsL
MIDAGLFSKVFILTLLVARAVVALRLGYERPDIYFLA